ncbi:hypothetical protein [Streptomyces sp. NPDC018347]|uniref:hypothetical protein n=1 Tax=Streptomyces sp. NPDC018347 TaxID=3157193 RepID=UPI0033E5EF02
MPESVPVRCPVCRRAHVYTAPAYPCVCGAPVAPGLDPAAEPAVAEHRGWDDEWLTVACDACGRPGQWPRPELGCPCGTVLRPAVAARRTDGTATGPGAETEPGAGAGPEKALTAAAVRTPGEARPPFRPRAVRSARDAVATAALYLRWLGHRDVRRTGHRPPNGIALAAPGLLAQVDPTVRPAAPRDVECLLTAMAESARCVYFSLAGYTATARTGADALDVPLFVLDLAGVPQPVNDAAETLHATGAPEPGTGTRHGQP